MPPISFPKSATLALCVLLTAPSTVAVIPTAAIAQSASAGEFDLPESVADGTVIRIDGSDSMRRINQVLQQGFEETYAGTQVQVEYSGTDAALSALEAGEIDLAAIGRPLTDEEKARGLRETAVERHKIALIVSPDNAFDGSLTTTQFARIFRGEITNWSVVGGEPGPIRLVDRPEESDTRQAFRGYPVFQEAPFEAGNQADPQPEDSTQAVIAALGEDGLGYAIAEQVFDDPNVTIVPMHDTMPDDQRYPFSQPLTYVYQDSPNPAVQSFLGYATAPINASALEAARVEGAVASIDGAVEDADGTSGDGDAEVVDPSGVAPGAAGDPAPGEAAAPEGIAPDGVITEGTEPDEVIVEADPEDPAIATESEVEREGAGFPWWLLLLLGIPLLLWLLLRRRPEEAPPATAPPETDPTIAPTPVPDVDPAVGMTPAVAPIPPATVVPDPEVSDPVVSDPVAPAPVVSDPEPSASTPAADPAPAAPPATLDSGVVGGLAAAGLGAGIAGAAASRSTEPMEVPAADAPPPTGAALTDLAGGATVGTGLSLSPQLSNTIQADWTLSPRDQATIEAQPSPLLLRLHDATDLDLADGMGPLVGEYHCDKEDRSQQIPVTQSDRDYAAELGYLATERQWVPLARSEKTRLLSPSTDAVTGEVDRTAAGLGTGGSIGTGTVAAAAAAAAMGAASAAAAEPLSAQAPESVAAQSRLALVAQSPTMGYAYWQLSPQDKAAVGSSALELRLYDVTSEEPSSGERLEPVDGLLDGPGGELISASPCSVQAGNQQVTLTPGQDHRAELGYLPNAGDWVLLAQSPVTRAPAAAAGISVDTAAGAGVTAPAVTAAAATAAAGLAVEAGEAAESTVTFTLPDGEAALAQWSIADADQRSLQGASVNQLELRVHDVTAIDLAHQAPHSTQTYTLSPTAQEQRVTVPVGDRDYIAELGYLNAQQGWTTVARSGHVHIPSSSPAVVQLGQVGTDSSDDEAGLPPVDGLAGGAAVAVGLGAVAPTTVLSKSTAPQVSQIILVPSGSLRAYAYWEISEAQRSLLKEQGGRYLKLRVHDATGLDIDYQPPHHTMEFDCQESDRDAHVLIPTGDRDYIAEVGYTTDSGDWLRIIRSFHTWIPAN